MAAKSTATRTERLRAMQDTDWQRVDAINREHEFDAEDDGFSIQEYADRYKLPRGTAEKRLKRLVAVGALVQGSRYVKTSAGLRKLRVFALAPKAA
jgi:Fic family protein